MSRFRLPLLLLAAPIVAGVLLASPAQAVFSEGYKFLEAVKKKDDKIVTAALDEAGSTIVNTRDITSGEGALHIVVARRDLAWLQFLVAKGANVNVRDNKGVTPLVLAVRLNFLEGVEFLLSKGARVDEANAAGETPLITAVHNRNVSLMRMLLKAGANPDRSDNSGRSARDYAALESTGNLIGEIQAATKPATAKPSYGPTF